MKRLGVLVILCLALGAVRAGAQTQSPQINVFTPVGPVVSGSYQPCLVVLNNAHSGQVAFLLGDPGTGSVSVGSQSFAVPLSTPMVIQQTMLKRPTWFGRLAVPSDPALVGWAPYLTAVLLSDGQFAVAPLVPFGPIIEDSIQ